MKYKVGGEYGYDYYEAANAREAAKQYLRLVEREEEGDLEVVDTAGNVYIIPYEITVSYDRWVGDPK